MITWQSCDWDKKWLSLMAVALVHKSKGNTIFKSLFQYQTSLCSMCHQPWPDNGPPSHLKYLHPTTKTNSVPFRTSPNSLHHSRWHVQKSWLPRTPHQGALKSSTTLRTMMPGSRWRSEDSTTSLPSWLSQWTTKKCFSLDTGIKVFLEVDIHKGAKQ